MRRRYSERQIRELLKAHEESQLSSQAFAEANSIPASTFYSWKESSRKSSGSTVKGNRPRFTTLAVAKETEDSDDLPDVKEHIEEKRERKMLISMPNGMRLEFDI